MFANRWPCEQCILGVVCLRRKARKSKLKQIKFAFVHLFFSGTVRAEFVTNVFHFSTVQLG